MERRAVFARDYSPGVASFPHTSLSFAGVSLSGPELRATIWDTLLFLKLPSSPTKTEVLSLMRHLPNICLDKIAFLRLKEDSFVF